VGDDAQDLSTAVGDRAGVDLRGDQGAVSAPVLPLADGTAPFFENPPESAKLLGLVTQRMVK
jgi:hypothetical protein